MRSSEVIKKSFPHDAFSVRSLGAWAYFTLMYQSYYGLNEMPFNITPDPNGTKLGGKAVDFSA